MLGGPAGDYRGPVVYAQTVVVVESEPVFWRLSDTPSAVHHWHARDATLSVAFAEGVGVVGKEFIAAEDGASLDLTATLRRWLGL